MLAYVHDVHYFEDRILCFFIICSLEWSVNDTLTPLSDANSINHALSRHPQTLYHCGCIQSWQTLQFVIVSHDWATNSHNRSAKVNYSYFGLYFSFQILSRSSVLNQKSHAPRHDPTRWPAALQLSADHPCASVDSFHRRSATAATQSQRRCTLKQEQKLVCSC